MSPGDGTRCLAMLWPMESPDARGPQDYARRDAGVVIAATLLAAIICAVLVFSLCSAANAGSDSSTIYVARRGWHIDIGMGAAGLLPPLAPARAGLPRPPLVFFGIGC